MALYTERTGRERNPLGGREADGFGQWLMTTAATVAETREGLTKGNVGRYIAAGADDHYRTVLAEWRDVQHGRSSYVRDELARDHFEVSLIAKVMGTYGAVQYARERGYGEDAVTAGGRPVADIEAEYLRACTILARYVGVSELTVAACQEDQDALTALRNTRA